MKALILAGGRGSRMNQFTEGQNKCMSRYEGRYVIENSLDNAALAGVEEIVIVVSYKAEMIINEFGNRYQGLPVRYVIQWERKGLVHAMECARETIGDSDFLLQLADEIMKNPRHREMIQAFKDQKIFASCGIVRAGDLDKIKKTYAVMFDEKDGRIHRLVEKPRTPLNDVQGTGNCLFRNQIFEYIAYTPINQQRQEKELPDLIQCAIDDGKIVRTFEIASWYANINTLEELDTAPD